jgi:hypothetical protein
VQSDSFHAVNELTARRKRVQDLNHTAARLQATRDQVANDLSARRQEVETLTGRVDRLVLVGELLRALMDKLVLDQVKSIEDIVTEGLKSIFFDQQLKFEAEVSQKYNKVSIDFFFRQGTDAVAVRGHPLESFGGGPSSIASLVLRLLSLLRLKRTPVILLDETLGAVNGDEYIDAAGRFLHKLATTTGIDILYVSQKAGFADHADAAYQAGSESHENGTWALTLRRLPRAK